MSSCAGRTRKRFARGLRAKLEVGTLLSKKSLHRLTRNVILKLIVIFIKRPYFSGPPPKGSGGKAKGKGKAKMEVVDGTVIKDFRAEYAKSGASTCKSCEEKIPKVGKWQIANSSRPLHCFA